MNQQSGTYQYPPTVPECLDCALQAETVVSAYGPLDCGAAELETLWARLQRLEDRFQALQNQVSDLEDLNESLRNVTRPV